MSIESKKVFKTPSRKTDGNYVVLMETNEEECESWYYFIRVEGNEENIKHLQTQLKQVEWEICDDLSTFDLELDHPVSAQTAKQMTKLDLNFTSFHRKFDGVLQKIDFDFKKKDGNQTKICKVFDILGCGQIDDYIDDEDIDEEDMRSESDSTDNESVTESEDSESDTEVDILRNKAKRLPPSIVKK
jgi:hypothetical protein